MKSTGPVRWPLLAVALALGALPGCEGEWSAGGLTGAPSRGPADALGTTYHAAWSYTVDLPALRRYETGTCYGELVVERVRGEDFSGAFRIPTHRTCVPAESGDFEGEIERDGDFWMQLRLPGGERGVFEPYENCGRVWADRAITGRVWDDHLQGSAEALYHCNMLGVGWTDIHIRVRLNASPDR